MKRKEQAIIIMSRIPVPGKTKTRLMTHLDGLKCAAFHQACLYDICKLLTKSDIPIYLFYEGEEITGLYNSFLHINLTPSISEVFSNVSMVKQRGQDLGDRLFNAGSEILGDYEKVVFLGADLPNIKLSDIYTAFDQLNYHDVVLGPAFDGGYYLLGIKHLNEPMFQNISWGTAKVLEETLDCIKKENLSVSLMDLKRDIDTWEDLVYFYNNAENDCCELNRTLISYQYAKTIF